MRKDKPSNRDYGQFLIIYDYVSLNGDEPSPVMALCGVKSKSSYIIPLENAYYFADSLSGGPSGELIELSMGIAQRLGLSEDRFTTNKIMDAIVDNLSDLISMPPKKPMTLKELEQKAERQGVVVSLDGQKILDAS